MLRDFLLREGPLKKEQVVKILKDGINMLSIEIFKLNFILFY